MKRICFLLALVVCCTPAWAKKKNEITVKTAEEFVAALGSNRTIVIDSRAPLMLTPVVEKLWSKGELPEYDYYNSQPNAPGLGWYDLFDGPGLSITGYDNLTIKSKGSRKATILVTPRYADVLLFENCNNLTLENLVLGHTESGYCTAGVLELYQCNNVRISGCDLFGCGTEAIIVTECMYVDVIDTEMHHCTYHSMHVVKSAHVRFKDCNIHDNREFEQITVDNCRDVWFEDCNFVNLRGRLFFINCDTYFYDCVIDCCQDDDFDECVRMMGPREVSEKPWSNWIQVTGNGVNLREEPSLDSRVQPVRLRNGEFAQKLDETSIWVKIYVPESDYGYAWIHKKYARDVPVEAVPPMVRDSKMRTTFQGIAPVDLGLSVDWGSANYGAEKPEEYGDFKIWDQAMQTDYPRGWRLPTVKEWEELLTLPHKIVQLPNEYRVAVFTAPNGNTLTIPTNGYWEEEEGNQNFGFYGYYWSQSLTSDALYPYGFMISVPDDLCRTGTLDAGTRYGTRLVREK